MGWGATACTETTATLPVTTTTTTIATAVVPPIRPDASSMRGVCPDPVVIQLAGPIDVWALPYVGASAVDGIVVAPGRYTAALLDPRSVTVTGIRVEIRTSAALPPAQTVSEAMHGDPTILLGEVGTEEALKQASLHPTIGVLAPWERSDLVMVWNATARPEEISIADLAATDLAANDLAGPAGRYLVGSAVLRPAQVVGTAGSNTAGSNTTLGSVTPGVPGAGPNAHLVRIMNEPDLPNRATTGIGIGTGDDSSATRYEFVDHAGWEPYEHSLAATPTNVAERSSCLRALVPLLQHATARVFREPDRLVANASVIAAKLAAPIDVELVRKQLDAALSTGILGDGPNATIGDLDLGRIEQFVRATAISSGLRGRRIPLPEALRATAKSLVDRSFTDPTVGVAARPTEAPGATASATTTTSGADQ